MASLPPGGTASTSASSRLECSGGADHSGEALEPDGVSLSPDPGPPAALGATPARDPQSQRYHFNALVGLANENGGPPDGPPSRFDLNC